jgi:hypothetical protein
MDAPVLPALDTDQVMVRFVALPGDTVPVRDTATPAVVSLGTPEIPATGKNAVVTVRVKF